MQNINIWNTFDSIDDGDADDGMSHELLGPSICACICVISVDIQGMGHHPYHRNSYDRGKLI